MVSYPYLQDLFTSVLSKSKAIKGRFYICPRMGHEINSQDLEQVLKDIPERQRIPKYPLVLMMPPGSQGIYDDDEFDSTRITLFFLKVSYNNADNSIATVSPNTRTSQHTVPQDWHDMKRAAVGFIRALRRIQEGLTILSAFRLSEGRINITPVSFIGGDRTSGVRLDFGADLFVGCDLEDYEEDDLINFQLPIPDSHPEHKL